MGFPILVRWHLFIESAPRISHWGQQNGGIGSDNGLVPNRQQAIIWTNHGLGHSHIYASLSLNEIWWTYPEMDRLPWGLPYGHWTCWRLWRQPSTSPAMRGQLSWQPDLTHLTLVVHNRSVRITIFLWTKPIISWQQPVYQYTPPHNEVVGGVYWFHSVCPSVHPASHVWSAVLFGSISCLYILSSNFKRCFACKVSCKISKFEFLAIF